MQLTFTVFILSLALLSIEVKSEPSMCASDNDLDIVKLKKNLLCNYEKTLRPVKNNNDPVNVNIRMIVRYFVYEVHDSSFSLDCWLPMSWKDAHLTWDPASYNSIAQIHLTSDEIWMPDLSIYNRNDQTGSPAAISEASCIVSSAGQVVCVPPTRQTSLCVGDMTRFPFDEQNCTVRFGSWIHSGEEIDFTVSTPPINTVDMVPNGEWQLVASNVQKHPGKYKCCPNNTFPSLMFSFRIRRLGGAHVATTILPALTLVVITLTSLWISPLQSERFYLCCVNLVCGYLYAQYISWVLPTFGDKIPLMLLFARDNLILTSFTILFSVVLSKMVSNTSAAPSWVSSIVSCLIGCRLGQFLLLDDTSLQGIASAKGDDDSSTIIQPKESVVNQDWIVFGKMLDRICFACFCLVYLCMLIEFTP